MLRKWFSLLFMALLLFPGIAAADPDSINLAVGEAKTISIKDFTKVANSNPEVVEVIITGGQDILLNAKKAGFSLVDVWKNKDRVSYKIIVQEDYSAIETDIGKLINNPAVGVKVNEKYVTLSGTVDNSLEADQAVRYGKIYRENIINNLIVTTHYQILLSILVTEIKKDSEKKYGLSWGNWWPTTDGLVFHDWENNFQGNNQGGLGLVSGVSIGSILNLMQSNGDAKILAAPSILTVSGKEALFLAGGEIPIPMPDGKGGTVVSWKEYGVKLTVTANFEKVNLISMAVSPEVSSIDWSNAIVVNGFKLPAFSTRKATTNVQFKDGSTLIIGGLLKREDAVNVYKFPILGDLPIIGALFRNKHFQKGDTELLFFVTPRIIRDDMKLEPETIVNPTPGPYFEDDQKK